MGPIFKGQAVHEDCLTPDNRTDREKRSTGTHIVKITKYLISQLKLDVIF